MDYPTFIFEQEDRRNGEECKTAGGIYQWIGGRLKRTLIEKSDDFVHRHTSVWI